MHPGAVSMKVSFVLRSAEAFLVARCILVTHVYRVNRAHTHFSTARFWQQDVYRVNADGHEKPSTPWGSRAVPQLSTDLALHRLAMEFEWDPACSMQYGRRLSIYGRMLSQLGAFAFTR